MKNLVAGLLFFSIFLCFSFLIFGQSAYQPSVEKTGFFTLHFANPSGLRSFTSSVAADVNVIVTLTITLPDTNVYGIEEQYPFGFTIVDSNGADVNSQTRHLYWLNQSAFSGTKIVRYVLKSPSYSTTGTFDGNYCYDDLGSTVTCNKFSASPQLITVTTQANPCLGAVDGTSCGDASYCCASTCVSAVNCFTCQYAGCSGAVATCLSSSASTQCGTTNCPISSCGGSGSNILSTYATTCNNFCNGSGACNTCSCIAINTNCGNSKYCSSSTKTCISCDSNMYNCDTNALNGCEVNLRTDSSNCGACGVSCGTGNSCSNGVCTTSICTSTADRYDAGQIIGFIQDWILGKQSLSDLLQKIQVYKYCK